MYGVVEAEAVVIKLTMKLLKNEDEQNLKILNEVLIAKRKSPFVMPPEGSAVIVLFSGGIDSVSLVSLLIEKYNYYKEYYENNKKPTGNPMGRPVVSIKVKFDDKKTQKY